jgi:DNA-binding transcriptional LysR family regulator
MPKSTVSRSVARLEAALATRLFQRNTREVGLTEAGLLLQERCADILSRVNETVDQISGLSAAPRGTLRILAGPADPDEIIAVAMSVSTGTIPLVSSHVFTAPSNRRDRSQGLTPASLVFLKTRRS